MSILVTGSNGAIGSQLVAHLAAKGADVHALVRKHPTSKLPQGVKPVQGDMTDVESMRAAYDMRLMMDQFQRVGMVANPGDTRALATLLSRPLRSYENLALELGQQWQQH